MNQAADNFISQSRKLLSAEYLPKITRCLKELPAADLWWKPNPNSNSAGNLIRHLSGNVRQWLVAGVGRTPDTRDRRSEFEASGGQGATVLLGSLRTTLSEADAVLASLTADDLLDGRTIQGLNVTVLEAVYHVVEHFSAHVGQLIYITKLRTGLDLQFYAMNEDGTVRRGWLGRSRPPSQKPRLA